MLERLAMPCMFLAAAGGLAAALHFYYEETAKNRIVLNEACSSNFSAVRDENGLYSDYVELYNSGDTELSLEGIYLSDHKKDLTRHSLEGVIVPAGGYALIWLDKTEGGDGYHAPFGISRNGETLYLSNEEGELLDSVQVPALTYNTSYGRLNGSEGWEHMTPTPGADNAGGEILSAVTLKEPVFSRESGFYEEEFVLELEAAAGEVIYYTLDGSDPDTGSYVYQEPIAIKDASQNENVYAARTDLAPSSTYTPAEKLDKATIVRAVAYNPQTNEVSGIVTKSYFVGFEEKEEYDDFPIISLVADPDNLFDPEYGIYTNGVTMEEYKEKGGLKDGELLADFVDEDGVMRYRYMATNAVNRGKEWEREANLTYFDDSHSYCFSQNTGIRISGQSTRGAMQKSLSIYGRDIYSEEKELPYSFFPGIKSSTIKLRNGGSENAGTKIMDAFLQSMAAGRNVATQASTPCVVFLNGEYWGIYNIRERYGEEYLHNHYGVQESDVWMIDSGNISAGGQEAMDSYEFMLGFVADCDMSDPELYEYACGLLDVQSLIDFYCINLYIDNLDVSFGQNIALWRTKWQEDDGYGDGRWRFMVFDVDGSLNAWDSNTFETSEPWDENFDLMDETLISGLMENEAFRKQFCLSFMDIANVNYAYARVHEALMEWAERYQVQVVKSHQRFFDENYSEEEFQALIEGFDTFFKNRFPFITACLAEELGLTGSLESVRISVNEPEGGTILINTSEIKPDPDWEGQYFTDYPITVTAVAEEGWRFAGWSGSISTKEAQAEVEIPQGGVVLQAQFERMES